MAEMSNAGGAAGGQNRGSSQGQTGAPRASSTGETMASMPHSVQEAAQRAGEVASNLGQRAGEAVSGLGNQMEQLAETIRHSAPQEGWVGSTASSVAESLQTSGRYLQQQDLRAMADDLGQVIRRYPLQAVLVGVGIGYLMARATRS